MVVHDLPKVETRDRFPYPAQSFFKTKTSYSALSEARLLNFLGWAARSVEQISLVLNPSLFALLRYNKGIEPKEGPGGKYKVPPV